MRRVLITGAAGLVGGVLREQLRGRYGLVLLDRAPLADSQPDDTVLTGDMHDAPLLARAVDGVDAVVHLAGEPTEASWEAIRDANIEGCYRVVEAARVAGVRRFVFASTNHVVGHYPRQQPLDDTCMPRPDTRYGVSKAFGEALLRYTADKFGMSAVCLRIGTVRRPDAPGDRRHLSTWISHRDLGRLVACAIEAPVDYAVVYGISGNRRAWWRDRAAELLGYHPLDDAETFAPGLPPEPPGDPVAEASQGGVYCSWERPGS